MEDTWTSRDLPVLEATVRLLDDPQNIAVSVGEVAADTGLDPVTVATALDALEGPFIAEVRRRLNSADPSSWDVIKVTPAARQMVGQWPTAESLVAQIAEGLGEAADHETNPQKKRRLREAASVLGETARGVVVEVVSRIVERQAGMG